MTRMSKLVCAIESCEDEAICVYYGLSLCSACWDSWAAYASSYEHQDAAERVPRSTEIIESYLLASLAALRDEQELEEADRLIESGVI